jgi:hypothetical protein
MMLFSAKLNTPSCLFLDVYSDEDCLEVPRVWEPRKRACFVLWYFAFPCILQLQHAQAQRDRTSYVGRNIFARGIAVVEVRHGMKPEASWNLALC